MKYKDYYKILGVSRDATSDEIRTAYRKLARECHPDLNPGDAAAEVRFKDISEANEVLRDPETRKRYDQLGAHWKDGAAFTPSAPGEGPGVEFGDLGDLFRSAEGSDFFEAFLGSRRGPRAGPGFAVRGADIEASMTLNLEEAYRGVTRSLRLEGRASCSECGGTGARGNATCPSCHGTGAQSQARAIQVNIPPGARPGSVIRVPAQGEPGSGNAPPGDLYLRIQIEPHPRFVLTGTDDIEITLPVAPWEAALGAKASVPTLDGPVEMTVPAGTQGGSRLRLRGRGLNRRHGARGDQYVRIRIVVPTKLSDVERELLERLARESKFNPREGWEGKRP